MSILTKKYFYSEKAAFKHVESAIWPNGPICPHCGSVAKPYDLAKTRVGLKKCRDCKAQFTVRVGTIFEGSHIPLHKWLQAIFLITSSKKGISAHQLHRTLEITYKSAWFLAHRIRETMKHNDLPPIGGKGEHVEIDETYFGTKDAYRGKPWSEKKGHTKKMAVVSLIHGGKARTFHADRATSAAVRKALENVSRESEIHTDESYIYRVIGKEFAAHKSVKHGLWEYVRDGAHVNSVEGYFSIFKRGMKGVYQHCSEKHLQRYLAEFDFRYNNRESEDLERSELALLGVVGKRLTYKQPIAKFSFQVQSLNRFLTLTT